MKEKEIALVHVDYQNIEQGKDLVMLLNAYALDPMGGGEPLAETVQENLVTELAKRHDFFTVIAYVEGNPAGIINCIEGFSTFKCKPLLNIHDCAVLKEYRGLGLSQKLFSEIENMAIERDCCKLTLEVLQGNRIAQNAYKKLGFSGYELDVKTGQAMFWEKVL